MSVRGLTFSVWACAAASAVAWGLKLVTPTGPLAASAPVASAGAALQGDTTRVLGPDAPAPVVDAGPAAAPTDARFQLLGLVAPRSGASTGIALIAVDGKPAKAYRLGTAIDTDLVLKKVQARRAELGPAKGPTSVTLELPPPGTGPSASPGAAALAVPGQAPGVGPIAVGAQAAIPGGPVGPVGPAGAAGLAPAAGPVGGPTVGGAGNLSADAIARRKAARAVQPVETGPMSPVGTVAPGGPASPLPGQPALK